MKASNKYLLLSSLLLITIQLFSQPSKDSIKIPRADALRVLAAADSGRLYQRAFEQCARDVDTLIKIANLKQSQINNLLNADKSNNQAIELLKNQKAEFEKRTQSLEKSLLKQQRKKKFLTFIGAGATITLGVLYLIK